MARCGAVMDLRPGRRRMMGRWASRQGHRPGRAGLRGVKPLRKLLPLLASLHDVGCTRDRAGNRELHFDKFVTLVLLMLLNPLIDSVRALQHTSSIEKVSARLGVKRFSRRGAVVDYRSFGSFSESVRCFDPDRLVLRPTCGMCRRRSSP